MPRYHWTKADLRRIRRRVAAGESLHAIGLDYGGAAHTTISRALKAEEAAEAKALAQREAWRVERERARRLRHESHPVVRDRPEDKQAPAPAPDDDAGSRPRRQGGRIVDLSGATGRLAFLNRQDARRPLTRADLRKPVDDLAEAAVDRGGGMQAVIEATGLRTRGNVVDNVDPAILEQARQNDAAARSASADESPRG